MTRIMLVDDHRIIREGIMRLISDEEDFEVVAELDTAEEALETLEEGPLPDLLISDLSLSREKMSGLEFIAKVAESFPELKVLVLSRHTEEAYIRQAIETGVAGYLPKSIAQDELLAAIGKIVGGESYFSAEVSKVMMNALVKEARGSGEEAPRLTKRELDIVRLIAEGMSSAEISAKLFISTRTVENHRANILQKLKLKNTVQLVRYVLKNNIVEL